MQFHNTTVAMPPSCSWLWIIHFSMWPVPPFGVEDPGVDGFLQALETVRVGVEQIRRDGDDVAVGVPENLDADFLERFERPFDVAANASPGVSPTVCAFQRLRACIEILVSYIETNNSATQTLVLHCE